MSELLRKELKAMIESWDELNKENAQLREDLGKAVNSYVRASAELEDAQKEIEGLKRTIDECVHGNKVTNDQK